MGSEGIDGMLKIEGHGDRRRGSRARGPGRDMRRAIFTCPHCGVGFSSQDRLGIHLMDTGDMAKDDAAEQGFCLVLWEHRNAGTQVEAEARGVAEAPGEGLSSGPDRRDATR